MDIRSMVPFGRARTHTGSPKQELTGFDALHREVDRLFDEFNNLSRNFGASPAGRLTPDIDVCETETEIEITAELPGMQEKDIDVSLAGDVLTIKGEKKSERTEDKGRAFHLTERCYGAFYRSVDLPAGVEPDGVSASMSNGVLRVTVQKPAQGEVRKIKINGS